MANKKYVAINGIYVEKAIFSTYFVCDYDVCKGKCCYATLSDGTYLLGGGLTNDEAKELTRKRHTLLKYVPNKLQQFAVTPVVYTAFGNFTCLSDNNVCCYSDSENRCCALKNAHKSGDLSFPIPVECSLYPLSYEGPNNKAGYLKLLHTFDEFCGCAYEKGSREKICVIDFVKDSIIRLLGTEFFDTLKNYKL